MQDQINHFSGARFLLIFMAAFLANSVSRIPLSVAQTVPSSEANPLTSPLAEVTFSPNDHEDQGKWPVAIKRVLMDGRDIPLGKPVHVSGNWLSSIKVIVENTTSRPIVFGTMILNFPETGSGQPTSPVFTTVANQGRYPDIALYRYDGTEATLPGFASAAAPISIAPGANMTFDFAQNQADQPIAYDKAGGQITKVSIFFQVFYFADNTKWTADTYFAPTGVPGQWQIIPPQQFMHSTPSAP
jgi:hypothetical protein